MEDPASELSIEEQIGQLLFIGLPGLEVDAATERLLNEVRPGGVCLFARNIKHAEQTRQFLDSLRSKIRIEPFLSVDEEGGLVDRLRRVLKPLPAASKLKTVSSARGQASVIGEALKILGFNMDFAPVIDVVDETRVNNSNGLQSRSFGDKIETVELAGAFLRELQAAGIIGCLKHFPGLGASEVDSHEELPAVKISEEEFLSVDLYPYRELLVSGDVHLVMVGHAAYPNLHIQERSADGRLIPSSLSSNFVSGLLREDLGFNGLVVTDDLEMGAIVKNYGVGEAAVMALAAGHDMVCICAGVDSIFDAYSSITSAVSNGRLSKERVAESVNRILMLKARLPAPYPFSPDEFSNLSLRAEKHILSLT